MLGDLSSDIDAAIAQAQGQYDLPSALSYIVSNYSNFQNIGGQIVALQRQASAQAARAAQLGRPDIQADLQQRIQDLGQLDVQAGNVIDEIDALDSGLHNLGMALFGQEPLTIAAALALAVAIAGTMALVFSRTSEAGSAITAQQRVLDMVAANQVTAQQGNALMRTISDTSGQSTQTGLAGVMNALKGIALPAAIVAVAVFVVPEVSKHVGRRR